MSGKLRKYEDGVARVIRNQAVPMTIFFYGLSQVIRPYFEAAGFNDETATMELVGETTTYKSALTASLAGSIWGKPAKRDGYSRGWNMSDQKIEDLLRDYDHHLLVLDEATLAHREPNKRGAIVHNIIHRVA